MDAIEKKRLLKDVTITHVSYVKHGANKKQFFFAKSECGRTDIQFDVEFFSKSDDDEKRLLYGVVYEPDTEDAHGDAMTKDEIEKTAHEFLEFYRNIDTEHNLLSGAGTVVESYIVPTEMSIGKNVIKAGSWILVTRATDEIWESWKAGDITGYSMFGISRETQMSKGETKLKKFVQKLLESVGLSKSFNDTMEATIDQLSKDPFFIMDMMQKDFFSNIDWSGTKEDDLTKLSASMREAANYIDGIVNVGKSDNGAGTEETTEQQTEDVPPENTEEPPQQTETETTPESVPEQKPEQQPETQKAETIINDMFTKLSKSNTEAIQQTIQPLTAEFDTLRQTIKTLETKIQDLETKSSLVQAPPKVQIEKTRNPGYGLLS